MHLVDINEAMLYII